MHKTSFYVCITYTTILCDSLPEFRKPKEIQFFPRMRESRKCKQIRFVNVGNGRLMRIYSPMVSSLQRLFYRSMTTFNYD